MLYTKNIILYASVPLIAIAGVSFYIAFTSFLTFLRARKNIEEFYFSLFCFAVGIYDLLCAVLYSASSPAEGAGIQRLQLIILPIVGIAFLFFVAHYTKIYSYPILGILTAMYLIAVAFQVLDRSDLTWIVTQPAIKVIHFPWGGQITYNEVTPGIVSMMESVISLPVTIYVFYMSIAYYRKGEKKRALPLIIAQIIFAIGVLNDTAVANSWYEFVYLIEYGYLALVILMMYTLSARSWESIVVKEAYLESEGKFREFVAQSFEGITILDEKGNIIEWNQANERMTGLRRSDVIGLPFLEIQRDLLERSGHDHSISLRMKNYLENFQKSETSTTTVPPEEIMLRNPAGKRFIIQQIGFPIQTSKNIHFGIITRDITALKEADLARQRSTAELMEAYDATIEGWSRALDLRDKETEGHTQRVAQMTERLAREMGVHQDELIQIRWGALLHDIGKLGIPDNILLKPGPLTENEWKQMRRHPQYAYDMLSPISYLKQAIDIPYCHHEKWNGTGYPRGLHGTQIPLSARIFAVVDTWDAMRSNRPYRKSWTKTKTAQEIKSLAGTQFDPRVVDAFLHVFEEEIK